MARPHVPPQQVSDAEAAEQERLFATFGAHLRKLRQERSLTIEAVAGMAGLHANYLGSVERGERNVSLFNIWRIADALQVPTSSLVEGMPQRKKPSAQAAGVPERAAII